MRCQCKPGTIPLCPHGHQVVLELEAVDLVEWTLELAPECCGAGCVAGAELTRYVKHEEPEKQVCPRGCEKRSGPLLEARCPDCGRRLVNQPLIDERHRAPAFPAYCPPAAAIPPPPPPSQGSPCP